MAARALARALLRPALARRLPSIHKNPLQGLANGGDPVSRLMPIRKLNDGVFPPFAENESTGGGGMGGTGGSTGGGRMDGTGGFTGRGEMGGFTGRGGMGGFTSGGGMGGTGGFPGGDRMGGFPGGDRMGGNGGFTFSDRMGGNGGFTPGGRLAGGFTAGGRMGGNGGFTPGGGRPGRFNMDLLQPTGPRVKRDVLHITQKGKKTFVTVTDMKGNRKAGASAGCLEDRKGRSPPRPRDGGQPPPPPLAGGEAAGGRQPPLRNPPPPPPAPVLPPPRLRLPPLPSSLPRASAVCSRWRALVSDPRFIRRFHLRHRGSPPLLGFFDTQPRGTCVTFVPALQAPNCVPTERLSLQIGNYEKLTLVLDCRHGLHVTRNQALVWDPATGDQHRADLPPEFDRKILHGAVIRAATNIHHFQFQMVLLRRNQLQSQQVIARVYSSETGVWGDPVSTPLPDISINISFMPFVQPTMVRNCLYWSFDDRLSGVPGILEFDLDHQSLAVIPIPAEHARNYCQSRVTRAEDCGLGFLTVKDCRAELWRREISCDGVASWVLGRTIELDKLLPLNPGEVHFLSLLGFSEENNVLFLHTSIGSMFMVQLEPLHFKRIPVTSISHRYQPFECVYAAGTCTGGGHDGAEVLDNT